MIRVLGIDPSLTHVGIAAMDLDPSTRSIAALVDLRMITTSPAPAKKSVRRSSDNLARARQIVLGLREAIDLHKPRLICVEVPSGTQSAKAAYGLGIAVGCLGSIDVPLVEVSPMETKLASVGTKTASKAEVIAWAVSLWPEADWPRSSRANEFDVQAPDGLTLSKSCEHLADGCAIVAAGLLTPIMQGALSVLS